MFEVAIDKLLIRTQAIAAWQRVAGTAPELAAFEYIQGELSALGAQTKLYLHEAFVSIPVAARISVDGREFACQTHSMAVSVANLQAPIVFGGKPAELTQALCQGKIVVLSGRAEREPIIKAANLGAVGVVCIAGDYVYESCISPVWGSPSHKNKHLLPQIPVVSINNAVWSELKNCMDNKSGRTAVLNTVVDSGWKQQPLLVAEVKARYPTDKFVMFSGHVDSWYHGAMDNATTNATMIEACRVALDNQDNLHNNLRVVFFSGYSQGRYSGSAWYFDNFWEDIHYHCVLSVNADSLGAIGADDLTRSTIMPEVKPVAKRIIKQLTGVEFEGRRYSRFADQSFWGTGVSCAFASFSKQLLNGQTSVGKFAIPVGGNLDLGWWWHTPQDTFDKIDPANLQRDARVFINFLMYYLTNKVVALDFRESMQEILSIIKEWQAKAGAYFDLTSLLKRAEIVAGKLELLYADIPTEQSSKQAITDFNYKLWKLGRILVVINYTQGNNYQNDLAVAKPPMPCFADINLLATANAQQRQEILLELVRSRNYVLHSLQEVLAVLN